MNTTRARQLGQRAEALQAALLPMLVEAERVAATLLQGTHGRRRSGNGEAFWQYRPYGFGDSTQRIDWRKSARSSHTFIRENEWEAANTLWLWVCPSPGMQFRSDLAKVTKTERANLLALALAALALRANERVGFVGSASRPTHSRSAIVKMAQHLLLERGENLPRREAMARNAAAVLIGDFLEPLNETEKAFTAIAEQGVQGHVVQLNDPAEETLPYAGRIQFMGIGQPLKFTAEKAEDLRAEYTEKFLEHRAGLKALAARLGWSFTAHHTDKPPAPLLTSLHARLSNRL